MIVKGAGKQWSVRQLKAIKVTLKYPFAHGRWGPPGTFIINADGC
jgi:hypothetical protein